MAIQVVHIPFKAHPTSPGELDAFIKEEVARMGKLIRDAGIRVE